MEGEEHEINEDAEPEVGRVCEREWGSENPLERGHAVLKSLNWREVAPVERDRERVSADELVDVSTEEKGELEGNVVVGDFLVRPLLLLFLVVRAAREVGDEGAEDQQGRDMVVECVQWRVRRRSQVDDGRPGPLSDSLFSVSGYVPPPGIPG